MKLRLNIPALILAALPGVPVFMFLTPQLLNASNSAQNYLGLALTLVVGLYWLILTVKIAQRFRAKAAVRRLLK